MFGLQILAVVVILAIAYRKEILSLFSKMVKKVEERKDKEQILSDDTKGFLILIVKVLLVAALLIGLFFICTLIFPGVLGQVIGGAAAFISLIVIIIVLGCC